MFLTQVERDFHTSPFTVPETTKQFKESEGIRVP